MHAQRYAHAYTILLSACGCVCMQTPLVEHSHKQVLNERENESGYKSLTGLIFNPVICFVI